MQHLITVSLLVRDNSGIVSVDGDDEFIWSTIPSEWECNEVVIYFGPPGLCRHLGIILNRNFCLDQRVPLMGI